MKQGETITISGTFTGLTGNLASYTVRAMIYCQDAKAGYKKLLYGTDYNSSVAPYNAFQGGVITWSSAPNYSFVIPPEISAKLQGECQLELSIISGSTTVISENYANFSVQNSILGSTLNG